MPEHDQAGVGVQTAQVFIGHAEHAAGAGGGVVQGAHHAGLGQGFVVFNEQQVDHQANHFAGGEMLAGGFIGQLGKLADQLFKHRAHFGVAHGVGVQVNGGEFFDH